MKTVIVCDHILKRNHYMELVELVCEMFPRTPVYTLAHHPQAVLGQIELRPIFSSYLTRVIKGDHFPKALSFLAPKAFSSFAIPTDTDLVISISNGLAHLVGPPARAKHISYIYSWDEIDHKKSNFMLFKTYLEHAKRNALKEINEVLVSSENVKGVVKHCSDFTKDPFVVSPVIKLQDYAFVKNETFFTYDYYAVDIRQLGRQKVKQLHDCFHALKTQARFFGENEDYQDLIEASPYVEYWGKRCSADLSLLFSGAKAVVNFDEDVFPHTQLCALATGRPFITLDNEFNRSYLKSEGGIFTEKITFRNIESSIKQMDQLYRNFDRNELRKIALKFSSARFRHEMIKAVKKYFPTWAPNPTSSILS